MVTMSDDAMDVVAEMHGGPRDGEIVHLPDLCTRWLFPAPADLSIIDHGEQFPTFVLPVMVYDVVLDPEMHRPSLSDAGRYRYEFKGYQ